MGGDGSQIPQPVLLYLAERTADLRRRKIKSLRLTPLLHPAPFADVLARRRSLFKELSRSDNAYGQALSFSRKVKPTASHPHGRMVEGGFQVLSLSSGLSLVASSLDLDAHRNGPGLLAKRAYPVAKRPFIPSLLLRRLIQQMATTRQWTATAVDAIGYDRKTLRFRRDTKQQPVDDAMAEMSEQGRQLHRVVVSFQDEHRREKMKAAFDRYGSATVLRGSIETACHGFIVPAVAEAQSGAKAYEVERAPKPAQQQVVQLVYRDEPFARYEGMNALCRAIRCGEGLSVSIVHLNPYLQAQVLDFFTGAAVELLVMDATTVSLLPRSEKCQAAMERVAAILFRYFGEAEVSRTPIEST